MELVRLLLKSRESAGFGNKYFETGIQKTLYRLKSLLPETNSIKEQLAYYWFKAGAYSEYVTESIDILQKEHIITKEQRDTHTLIVLCAESSNQRLAEHDEEMQEARNILRQIVMDMDAYSIDHEIRAQYDEHAPTLFYPRFKLGFMPELITHQKKIDRGDADLDQKNCLTNMLNAATASLPINSLFAKFKPSYFDFEAACCRTIKWADKENMKQYQELISAMSDLSVDVWNTFAFGARIMKHDRAYEGKMQEWKSRFDEEVSLLSHKINEFYLKTLQVVKPLDYDERAITREGFFEHILDYRKNKEIAYINFFAIPKGIEHVPDHVKEMPEYHTLTKQGQLDWLLIRELNDQQLRHIMEQNMTYRPIHVAYAETYSKTTTYRIINPAKPVEPTSA